MARKICVMTSAHPPSDVRIFHKQCKSLALAGYQVCLIASVEQDTVCDGIQMISIPRSKGRVGRIARGTLAVYRRARALDADIYHFHDPELIPVGLLLRAAGKTVVYDIHEDVPRTISYKPYIPKFLRAPVSHVAELIENWAGGRFSGLVAATPTIGNRFRAVNRNVAVVNNYPRIEELESLRFDEPPAELGNSMLYVGMRITRARGAEEMVRAMGLLPAELDASLKLVGGWDPPGLPESLSKLPGWERTESLGLLNRGQVARELHQARAGLVILHPEPNYIASQPVKLFEYMCAGIPVIVSDFPVCREIVTEAGCGLLVDPLSPQEIARAMEYLLTHPEEARAMGQRGYQAVHQLYNWDNEEKVLLEAYSRLLETQSTFAGSLVNTGSTL
jgi:glycosyltransferase involved in cell wall biosynthesis